MSSIIICVEKPIPVVDYSNLSNLPTIKPGQYELVKVPNPQKDLDDPWVIKGTSYGQIEEAWKEAGIVFPVTV